MAETNKMLAILDNYLHDNPDEIAKEIADEFRRRSKQYCEIRAERTHIAEESHRHSHGAGIHLRNTSYILRAEIQHHGGTAADKTKHEQEEGLQEIEANGNESER